MAEYIGCRKCDSTDCKGCNLKNLETMLRNGKFDCIMNENRCINTTIDVAPVVHGRWVYAKTYYDADECNCSLCGQLMTTVIDKRMNYCPNCGAKMDGGDGDD